MRLQEFKKWNEAYLKNPSDFVEVEKGDEVERADYLLECLNLK
jgi:hypothetical protein